MAITILCGQRVQCMYPQKKTPENTRSSKGKMELKKKNQRNWALYDGFVPWTVLLCNLRTKSLPIDRSSHVRAPVGFCICVCVCLCECLCAAIFCYICEMCALNFIYQITCVRRILDEKICNMQYACISILHPSISLIHYILYPKINLTCLFS